MDIHKLRQYHSENLPVFLTFESEALKLAETGRQHYSARTIIEFLRHQTAVRGNDEFKINNNMAPYYARLFEYRHPEYTGFFEKRTSDLDDHTFTGGLDLIPKSL